MGYTFPTQDERRATEQALRNWLEEMGHGPETKVDLVWSGRPEHRLIAVFDELGCEFKVHVIVVLSHLDFVAKRRDEDPDAADHLSQLTLGRPDEARIVLKALAVRLGAVEALGAIGTIAADDGDDRSARLERGQLLGTPRSVGFGSKKRSLNYNILGMLEREPERAFSLSEIQSEFGSYQNGHRAWCSDSVATALSLLSAKGLIEDRAGYYQAAATP